MHFDMLHNMPEENFLFFHAMPQDIFLLVHKALGMPELGFWREKYVYKYAKKQKNDSPDYDKKRVLAYQIEGYQLDMASTFVILSFLSFMDDTATIRYAKARLKTTNVISICAVKKIAAKNIIMQ